MSASENRNMTRIGIDIGALFVKLFAIYPDGGTAKSYTAHHGDPAGTVQALLRGTMNGERVLLGLTGCMSAALTDALGMAQVDLIQAGIAAVRESLPDARNIIDIGGASATLIRLNEDGRFLSYNTNSLCAAGTGSFLDEQARRLDLDYQRIAEFSGYDDPPHIATRCAVFAKSDLIHHQQAGASREACWSGLCRGMTRTMLQTLLAGRPLQGLTAVIGGVGQNKEVLRWLREQYRDMIRTFEDAHLAGARGAAMLAAEHFQLTDFPRADDHDLDATCEPPLKTRPALRLVRTEYPSFHVLKEWLDERQSEIRISKIPESRVVEGYLGVDIGSTSTKLVFTDQSGEVLVDVYRKTQGDPIGATQNIFSALDEAGRFMSREFRVRGAATTGSGRKMVGLVIGADLILNEITAHVHAAMHVDPLIDTIFEIGGQDSKYMRTVHGRIQDANMNYVCAAGTGSFVEEQARKLGMSLGDIGDAVLGLAPPHTSDRCTVFMEMDVGKLLRGGCTREQAMAAVLYSVVQNYLNKVVEGRYYSRKKIFFQGATARNPGLVAAFENLLGVEMVVSPYCHQMGAWGAALEVGKMMEKGALKTNFRGLDLNSRRIELHSHRCALCTNHCEITGARIEGLPDQPSWGYLCGRDPDEKTVRRSPHYNLFQKREKWLMSTGKKYAAENARTVGLPLSLTTYSFLPLWRAFFGTLGYKVKTTRVTDPEIKQEGVSMVGGEFCFPVKAAHGHARMLLKDHDLDFVMIPFMISNTDNAHTTNSFFCPYVQAHAGVVRSACELNGIDTSRLLGPVIDLRWDTERLVSELHRTVGGPLGRGLEQIKSAWQAGMGALKEFQRLCEEEGEKALREMERENRIGIVIAGRPYNAFDRGLNLGLVRKIAELGYTVIPLDFLPFRPESLGEEFRNLYWNYAQRIISGLRQVKANDRLFALYLTNFNCGPDSFNVPYAQEVMGQKPMLVLELDEHSADAGYMTRIEAFLDVVKNYQGAKDSPQIFIPETDPRMFKERTLWIPNMHPIGATLGAAAFRGFGYDARVLPIETNESFEIGRQVTSGAECLPTTATIGALLHQLRKTDADPQKHAFFMATATGPCRFGQYALKHRMILNELGYGDVIIMSPSSINSYQGLPEKLRRLIWRYFVAADILFKLRCKKVPYELSAGETERVLSEEISGLAAVIESNRDFSGAFRKAIERIQNIPSRSTGKPLVGVVGEIYVRCNGFANDYVIRSIEEAGGEAWLAPLSEWFLYTATMQSWSANQGFRGIWARSKSLLKNHFLKEVEHELYREALPFLAPRLEPDIREVIAEGAKYLPVNFEGEAIITIGRAIKFIEQGAAMVVNCAPFGCMPGTLTAAIFQQVQQRTGVPIVNMFYDGESGMNNRLKVFLNNLVPMTEREERDIREVDEEYRRMATMYNRE